MPVHNKVGCLEAIAVHLLISHLLLHILLDVAHVVVLFHLEALDIILGFSLFLPIVKVELLDIVLFLSLVLGAFPVKRHVSLLDPAFLLVLLKEASVEQRLLLLPHLLKIFIFQLHLDAFLFTHLSVCKLSLRVVQFLLWL